MLSRDNLMWLAGYLEGEGCFTISISRSRGKNKAYRILVTSEDIDVIRKASILLVGYPRITSSKPRNYHKTFYGTNVNGASAIGWMMTLYSLMGERRKKRIKYVINDWKNNIRKYSTTERAIRERLKRNRMYKQIIPKLNNTKLVNPFAAKDVTKNLTNEVG